MSRPNALKVGFLEFESIIYKNDVSNSRGDFDILSFDFVNSIKITNFAEEIRQYNMARPIKETPILFGDDAKRFEQRMQNPPKVSTEKREEIRRSYETVLKMMVN